MAAGCQRREHEDSVLMAELAANGHLRLTFVDGMRGTLLNSDEQPDVTGALFLQATTCLMSSATLLLS